MEWNYAAAVQLLEEMSMAGSLCDKDLKLLETIGAGQGAYPGD
jgi:hypothetical protein